MLKMHFTSSRCFKGDAVTHTTPPWAIDGDQGISLKVTDTGSCTATTGANGYAAHLPRDGGMPPKLALECLVASSITRGNML